MTARTNPYADYQLVQPLIDYAGVVERSGLEPSLAALVKIRTSQVNGCAMCLALHTREAREAGESEQRIFMLDAWRESPLYSERERAALAWTEALTRLSETRAPDADYEAVAALFTASERVTLTLLIGVINSFNLLGVGFRIRHPVAKARSAA